MSSTNKNRWKQSKIEQKLGLKHNQITIYHPYSLRMKLSLCVFGVCSLELSLFIKLALGECKWDC